jgi:hypothetical protein
MVGVVGIRRTNYLHDLKVILSAIFHQKHTLNDLSELVRISKIIVTAHLSNSYNSILRLCYLQGISLVDLSYDCIGEIFEKDVNNNLITLRDFYVSLRLDIDELPEEEIYLAYKGLLLKIADAQIAHLYAQLDPTGFKIQRNIKETVLKTSMFSIKKTVLGIVLTITENSEYQNLPYVDLDKLLTEFKREAFNKKLTGELLGILRNYLMEQKEFRKEIRLVDAVFLFKSIFGVIEQKQYEYNDQAGNVFQDITCQNFEIEQITGKVLDKIKTKILLDYYTRGKLTRVQAEAIYFSIHDIVHDWISLGKNHSSLYEYLQKHLIISKEDYHSIIRDKFEYLIKTTREELKLYFMAQE